MAYIDYQTYKEMGGNAAEADFPALEAKARRILDYWTIDRIDEDALDEWGEAIELCMVEIIDNMPDPSEDRVTSFSNGVDSFGFADETEEERIHAWCVRILPIELCSQVVSYEG